jgi:hypothetical protein
MTSGTKHLRENHVRGVVGEEIRPLGSISAEVDFIVLLNLLIINNLL